ncbi:unnamed protein product [Arctia plantaginis]|uniref:Uncharacterized protein n=1 Tax=Arctia plantaginis TaxID=874455 RepID=A0A8S1B7S2_ARCPL|nr:unnamed protein product [Arctia plantaginis]
METTFGYIMMGRAQCDDSDLNTHKNNNKTFFCSAQTHNLEDLTQRFWELERVPGKVHTSPDDEVCERIFQATHSRNETGRYTVTLPFKYDPLLLGNSYNIAKKRLINLERKLDNALELRSDYNATIQNYIDQGYLSKVNSDAQIRNSYYIPHRAVYRPDKSTSKIRVVLDASANTTSGKSLNDLLFTGTNLQQNIFNLLINLRMFSIAMSADIEKMYFQV